MFPINNQLEEELLKFNINLKNKYKNMIEIDEEIFRDFLENNIGSLFKLKKPSRVILEEYESLGGVVGVDGSVNKKGGAYPHFIEMFQGLALSTKDKENPVKAVDMTSPLMDKEYNLNMDPGISIEEKDILSRENRNEILASIEVKVGLEAAKKFKPFAILMDGSLLRFHLYSRKVWEEFKSYCERENILLIGVIEEVKTQIISKEWQEAYGNGSYGEDLNLSAYDKEMLFGRLEYGEMLVIRDEVNTKRQWTKGGIVETIDISSAFLRSALTPSIIGIDILGSQQARLQEMASLVLGLTPENSRGIPLWLDLVDREARITNRMMESLLEKCIDTDLYERLFVETRSKRTI